MMEEALSEGGYQSFVSILVGQAIATFMYAVLPYHFQGYPIFDKASTQA